MSWRSFRVRIAARQDLHKLAYWLRREADPDTAARVIAAARRSFAKLPQTPGLGPPADAKAEELSGARRWQVQGYLNYLIFYVPTGHGVDILRVFHAAQGWRVP